MGKETIKTIIQLATSGFGLVAALAWNGAIQSLFTDLFGKANSTVAQFGYAALVTLLVVFITTRLGKIAEKAGISSEQKK